MKNNIWGLVAGLLVTVLVTVACKRKGNQSEGQQFDSIADSVSVVMMDSMGRHVQDSLSYVLDDEKNTRNVVVNDDSLGLRQSTRKITGIVVHCSASADDVPTPIDSIIKSHRMRGFRAIGYHFYITRDGVIHKGRDLRVRGAHVSGHNLFTIGICYEGGLRRASLVKGMEGVQVPDYLKNHIYKSYTTVYKGDTIRPTVIHGIPYVSYDTRTNAQKKALKELIEHLRAIYPNLKVCGHRDFSVDKNHDGVINPTERIKDCPCFDAMPEYKYESK